jgi:TonB family protein
MTTNDLDLRKNTHTYGPGEFRPGLVHPKRISGTTTFPGWGPKLFGLTLAVGAALAGGHTAASAEPATRAMCANPNRDAAIMKQAYPDMPAFAELANEYGDVVVRIDLAADGTVAQASIAKSSYVTALDSEALRVAQDTRFAPAIASCHAVPSSYLYTVSFYPQ